MLNGHVTNVEWEMKLVVKSPKQTSVCVSEVYMLTE